jgi:3-oxoadipate enol-lactonase
MAIAELPELEVHYEEYGSGQPLLLVPGIPAVASDWRPLATELAGPGRHVIAYDNRGSGASTVTPGPYTTAQLAADAVALLDELGIDRADVFGMSLGGMIAQELALNAPDRVRGLVLGCTHAGGDRIVPVPRETARAFALETDDWEARMRALAPLAFTGGVDRRLLDAFIAKKCKDVQDPIGYQAQVAAAATHDAVDRLPRISAPTLVVCGEEDRIIPSDNSRVIAGLIPGAAIEVIPGAGHLFFLERPAETLDALVGFLDGVDD